jgi:hypothetical protein
MWIWIQEETTKSEEISCFEVLDFFSFGGWRLLLYLGRPIWRLKDKFIAIFYKKIKTYLTSKILKKFGHKSLD